MNQHEASEVVRSLFRASYAVFVGYAFRRTGRLEVAEDVVQEAFFSLYRQLLDGKTVKSARAWLLTVIRREISKQAGSDRFPRSLHDSCDVLDLLAANRSADGERAVQTSDLGKLLSVLTRREEEVILLRLAALKYREIAAQLGISHKTVSTLLTRALRKLQNAANNRSTVDRLSIREDELVPKTLQ